MPTQGHFVCHVHCLVHDGAVRSSPCRPHHENFGRNLYHMFIPAYFASQPLVLFSVVVFELLQCQRLIPYPFLNGVLILLCEYQLFFRSSRLSCQSFFNWRVSLQVDPIISTSVRSIISSSQRCYFFRLQVAFVFSHPPSLCFSPRIQISYPSIHLIDVKSLHPFPSMFLSGDSHEDSNGASSSSFLVLFFSGRFNSSFRC